MQERDPAGSCGFQKRGIHRITAGGQDAKRRVGTQEAGGQLLHAHAIHGGIEHRHGEIARSALDLGPSLVRAARGNHGVTQAAQVYAHHFEQRRFVVYDQDLPLG